ncbi:MAG TPA: hypothetical protein VK357_14680 [Rubrobacteraceae bacterium]|jgi:hypothetical protein|nr:hypothetical protein [Rubrobacteraceae bacterium]
MAVSPALAHDRDRDGWDEDFGFWVFVPVFFFDVDFDGVDDNCDFVYCNGFDYNDFDSDDDDFDDCEWEWSDVFEEWELEC